MSPWYMLAVPIGAALGAGGALTNRVHTWDERLLWVLGGSLGAAPASYLYAALAGTGPLGGLAIYAATGILGVTLPPRLDARTRRDLWALSAVVKWLRSPLTTTFGVAAAIACRARGRPVDFQAGMIFVPAGKGASVLALGAVGWAQHGRFAGGCVARPLACHEAVHSRTVAAIGELGFYFTYVLVGAPWAVIQGADWNNLSRDGLGNPFEKTAHTFTGDPPVAVEARRRRLPA
ncbi:MAG: hypothetical protein KY393_01150 [Actinobacteria bacterium]|nr:hypothetical protein [Actinomycetota bacterium]